MDISALSHYRNLAGWHDDAWQALDIHLFIAANYNRYCSGLLKRIGMQYLPSDATDCLLSLFSDVAHRPLEAVHQRNLNAEGERRNQIMLGSLKMIATTRVLEALIKEFPSHISLDVMTDSGDWWQDQEVADTSSTEAHQQLGDLGEWVDYAAECAAEDLCLQEETLRQPDDEQRSLMVENVRSHLTPAQYKHLRLAVCEGLDPHEIAERTGHSVTNVRIMLLNARKTMLNLVPGELREHMEPFIYRKQRQVA